MTGRLQKRLPCQIYGAVPVSLCLSTASLRSFYLIGAKNILHIQAGCGGQCKAKISSRTGLWGSLSNRFDEAFQHHFAARFVEVDGQFVAIDPGNGAVAEFNMKDAGSLRQAHIGPGRAGNDFALDLHG